MPLLTAPYACKPEQSRGRLYDEAENNGRSAFQRDRDRIIHSTAFRRLKHKTQVFAAPEGDHYRTRLTHSLEVSQIARSVARSLELDEDLTETLALAHDLGHPPFGHAGERTLAACMASYGGFDHNVQSLKLVTELERRYAGYDGLNLTWEALEGLIKHNGPVEEEKSDPLVRKLDTVFHFRLNQQGSAEAQIAALADDIAYNAHDIDDGLRSGLIHLASLEGLPLIGAIMHDVRRNWPDLEQPRFIHETIRRLISFMIHDLTSWTRSRIEEERFRSADEIRACLKPTAAFSAEVNGAMHEIKQFLYNNMYRHADVMQAMETGDHVLNSLFERYMYRPSDLPFDWRLGTGSGLNNDLASQVCDFIAGMTDTFAIREYERLFDESPEFR